MNTITIPWNDAIKVLKDRDGLRLPEVSNILTDNGIMYKDGCAYCLVRKNDMFPNSKIDTPLVFKEVEVTHDFLTFIRERV